MKWYGVVAMQRAFCKVSCRLNRITSQKSEETAGFSALVQTWGRYQHPGPAAAEAVQQRPAADVLVEEGHGGAQLGQGQPGEREGGLIPHEKRHGVPSLEARQRLQRVGGLVADSVRVWVGVLFIFENDEGFVRIGSSLLEETIQNEEKWSPSSPPYVRQ